MNLSTVSEKLQELRARFARDSNVCVSMANKVNVALLLFDDQMVDLHSGRSTRVSRSESDPQIIASTQGVFSATELAEAAAALLMDSAQTEKVCVLLLPPSEFYISETTLPPAGLDLQRSALLLQAMTVLPEFEETLNVGFIPGQKPALPVVSSGLAAWLPTERTESLFEAFLSKRMFLASVVPRLALFTEQLKSSVTDNGTSGQPLSAIEDEDHRLTTVFQHNRHGLMTCIQSSASDRVQPELYQKFLQERGADLPAQNVLMLRAAADYLRYNPFKSGQQLSGQSDKLANLAAAGVFPEAALSARHQLEQGRLRKELLRVVAAAVLVVSLPFVWQSFQLLRLDAEFGRAQEQSLAARADQAVVRDFENNWGAFNEFPEQDVGLVLLTLQPVINPGLLSAFALDEGLLSIEGESPDPQNILEQLEQNPMFTEVDFARATNNNRYFIDLRLSTVNFSAYREWHFPEPR
jgi:hypothetical protein